jgi:hypothetical protein
VDFGQQEKQKPEEEKKMELILDLETLLFLCYDLFRVTRERKRLTEIPIK